MTYVKVENLISNEKISKPNTNLNKNLSNLSLQFNVKLTKYVILEQFRKFNG